MHDSLEHELKEQIAGEVHFDAIHRKIYSVDASIYEVEPTCIVIPKNKDDIITTLKIAKKYRMPVIPRGAATGITGGCIGSGIIIDLSKYLNKILKIDYDQEYAICEPGVIQDKLNGELAAKGYRLGPDTSTGNRATIGGMLANNAAGARSLRYGKMVDHVEEVELALASGKLLRFHAIDEASWEKKRMLQDAEGDIYRTLFHIHDEYKKDIVSHFPKIPRRVSGYNLDELIKPGLLNVCKLITGSEGTLGITTEIKVKICKKPRITGVSILHFHDMIAAMRAIPAMLTFHPLSLEMIDEQIIALGRNSPAMKGKLQWLVGSPQAVFVAEFEGGSLEEVQSKLSHFESEMKQMKLGYAHGQMTDPIAMSSLWDIRKAGLGILMSRRSYSRAIAFIEDITLPPEHLGSFMEKFRDYLKSHGKEAGIYGHVGSGCMHVRPFIDLRNKDDVLLMEKMMHDISSMLLEHGGALSGEHGDGRTRSWLNKKMFGDRLYQAFVELKSAFDQENRMNPGKVVHGTPFLEHLRLTPDTKISSIKTFMDFGREGGFELAVDMCNGNGQCRKTDGVMCPSFQATGDEYDSTRGRAQALRAVINGRLPIEEFTGKGLYDILELCLECKGCKTECPSQVDMAKMKAEFLYHYQEKWGYSLRSRLFGHIGLINKFASPIASLFNFMASTTVVKTLLSWIGVAPERSLPSLASQRFSAWFKANKPKTKCDKQVVLFIDTYTEFNNPEIGQAAVKVLSALGYEVIAPAWKCCGRPFISKGLLKQAKTHATELIETLHPYAVDNIPIIGLEPSCILTIKDEFLDLAGKAGDPMKQKAEQVMKASLTFDEFLNNHIVNGKLPLNINHYHSPIKLHGHCHQKSLVGTKPTLNVLKAISEAAVTEIASGCCGVAGSFGYEKEHYALSIKIGELRLLPEVRASSADTVIVADGVSCRSQISHATQRTAKHLAEVIAEVIRDKGT